MVMQEKTEKRLRVLSTILDNTVTGKMRVEKAAEILSTMLGEPVHPSTLRSNIDSFNVRLHRKQLSDKFIVKNGVVWMEEPHLNNNN